MSKRSPTLERASAGLARLVCARPYLVLAVGLLTAAGAGLYAWRDLGFEGNRNALVPQEAEYNKAYLRYLAAFERSDDFLVVATGPDPQALERFGDELGPALERSGLFARVTSRLDTEALAAKGLLYLSPEELRKLGDRLTDNAELLAELSRRPGLNHLFTEVNARTGRAAVSHLAAELIDGGTTEAEGKLDPGFLRALVAALDAALAGKGHQSPWETGLAEGGHLARGRGLARTSDDRFSFVLLEPRKLPQERSFGARALAAARAEVARLRPAFPSVEAGVTGRLALTNDESATSGRDMAIATIVALFAVTVVFLIFFRGLRYPIMSVVSMVIGILWTFGFTTVAVGYLTVLSVAFTAILVGVIDFGIHILLRFEEGRGDSTAIEEPLARTLAAVGPSVAAGALTAAAAFYALMFSGFKGLAEVGLIAGSGALLACLSAFTVLPAMLVIVERRRGGRRLRPPRPWRARFETGWMALTRKLRPRAHVVLLACAGLTAAAVLALPRLSLDFNLLNLQAKGVESVVWERRLLEQTERSIWYAASLARSREEVAERQAAFQALPTVERVQSVLDLVPADQAQKLELARRVGSLLPPPAPAAALTPVDIPELTETLRALRFKLGTEEKTDAADRPALTEARVLTTHAIQLLRGQAEATTQARLDAFARQLFDDLARKLGDLREAVPEGPLTLADVPATLRSQFVSGSGLYLLQIYPRQNIWDHANLERFVRSLRDVDPQVTGSPVQTFESARAMKNGYLRGGLYAVLTIAVILLLTLRSARLAALAFLPVAFAFIWTFGVMGATGISLNLANMIMLPLLVGLGIECGIHTAARAAESGSGGFWLLETATARGVAATGLTTMAGFASLLVARHHGIFSIGLVLTIGIAFVLLASLLLVPAVMQLMEARRSRRRSADGTVGAGEHARP